MDSPTVNETLMLLIEKVNKIFLNPLHRPKTVH